MTPEEQAAHDKVERALVESRPSFLTDGHGLRGPSPQLGQSVRSMDGADGGFGAMQVKPQTVQQTSGGGRGITGSIVEVILLDFSDDTFYFHDLYETGRKDPV